MPQPIQFKRPRRINAGKLTRDALTRFAFLSGGPSFVPRFYLGAGWVDGGAGAE